MLGVILSLNLAQLILAQSDQQGRRVTSQWELVEQAGHKKELKSMIYGLKIQVDFQTGKRAGNIDPRDPGLVIHPHWQNVDEGCEVRVIEDDRNVEQYRNIPGVELLKGEIAINTAIQSMHRERYAIKHEQLLIESIRQKKIDITGLTPDMKPEEIAKALYQKGTLGVVKSPPPPKVGKVSEKVKKLKTSGLPTN